MKVTLDVRSLSITGLFVLALLYTVYLAKPILLPLILAVLLALLFAPVVAGLCEAGVPRWLSAGVVVVGLVAVSGWLTVRLAQPTATWIASVPDRVAELERKVQTLREPVRQVTAAAKQVEDFADLSDDEEAEEPTVAVQRRSVTSTLLEGARGFVASTAVTMVLVYFLLASGDLFLRKLMRVLPTFSSRRMGVLIARKIRNDISAYLRTVTLNTCLGITVGLAMTLLGMPNPVLWGVMAALLNFVPYLGALVGVAIVGVVAFTTFDDLGFAVLPPLIYWGLTALEGMVIRPTVLGHRLALNELAVFVGVIFWGWLWGVPGALLAVPILASVKVVADHQGGMNLVSEFLGR